LSDIRALAHKHEAALATTCTDPAIQVITYLNQKAERYFRAEGKSVEFVRARLSEGITVQQLMAVIDNRVAAWKDDPKMSEYLRPATLFNRTKCESYLGLVRTKPTTILTERTRKNIQAAKEFLGED
jgi:uncharacterized phage protein (TIGR02220 family)